MRFQTKEELSLIALRRIRKEWDKLNRKIGHKLDPGKPNELLDYTISLNKILEAGFFTAALPRSAEQLIILPSVPLRLTDEETKPQIKRRSRPTKGEITNAKAS